MSEIDWRALAAPFAPEDIEWRVGQQGEKDGKPWAKVLAYVTNRAIQDRLDQVAGPGNWRNEYREFPGDASKGLLCGLSIRMGDAWITKWDGAEQTDIESVKGGLSNAMKRAAVQWGIGRYLYHLEEGWAQFSDRGAYSTKTKSGQWAKWNPPQLPAWALPGGSGHPGKGSAQKVAPSASEGPSEATLELIRGAIKRMPAGKDRQRVIGEFTKELDGGMDERRAREILADLTGEAA